MSTACVSSQMALDIFEELRLTDTPISESPKDIGFARNNIFLDVADVGLTGRRALDAAYFLVAQHPDQKSYEFDLGYFKWLMNYDSNNRKHLRTVLRETQKASIQVNDIDAADANKDRWVSVQLMGTIGIAGGRIVFEVPEPVRRQLKDPASYTYLSLRIKGRFSSLYATLLYDRMAAFAYRGGTEWTDLDVVREWLGCSDSKTLAEYKYLKRDVLDPAISQVNCLSDLTVRYETRSGQGTKRIAKIKFIVTQHAAELSVLQPLGSQKLYETLRDEFGLSAEQFDEIVSNRDSWTDDWIQHAVEFTRDRITKGSVKKSPAGFLMMAIKQGLKISTAERQIADQAAVSRASTQQLLALSQEHVAAKEAADKRHTDEVSAVILNALAAFDFLGGDERGRLVREFARSPVGKAAAARCKVAIEDVDEAMIRKSKPFSKALGSFLAPRLEAAEA